jgi:hypothetical protein
MTISMRKLSLGFALALLTAALPAAAQVGHPAKGSWSGYWGPSPEKKNRILLVLDWVDNQIVGTINPGPKGVKLDKATLDVSTWTLTIEANMPAADGRSARYVATGKLENLGSWTNRTYSGTYRFGDERGTFKVALN